MVVTWWQLRCNSDLGWFVDRWVKDGTRWATVVVTYGPMAHAEIFDVVDSDTTVVLLNWAEDLPS